MLLNLPRVVCKEFQCIHMQFLDDTIRAMCVRTLCVAMCPLIMFAALTTPSLELRQKILDCCLPSVSGRNISDAVQTIKTELIATMHVSERRKGVEVQ